MKSQFVISRFSSQDKSIVAIRCFFVARKPQKKSLRQGKGIYHLTLERCLKAKKNAQNRPEKVQLGKVLGVSAFWEQIAGLCAGPSKFYGGGDVPRMSKKHKEEWALFLDARGRKAYCDICHKCERECKQSFRATVVQCPKYLSKRRLKENDAE